MGTRSGDDGQTIADLWLLIVVFLAHVGDALQFIVRRDDMSTRNGQPQLDAMGALKAHVI